MNTEDKARLLSTGDVVEELGIPPYTVQYLLSTGVLPEPELRVSGNRAWQPEEVERARKNLKRRTADESGAGGQT